jgi:hypothetical protein
MGEGGGGLDYETRGGEEDANSREKRDGTAMGEPHAQCRQEELAPGEGRWRETRGSLVSLNLLKWLYSNCICLPKTGITLLNNQRGYVHSKPPVFIRTVVLVGVNIAARKQHF